MHTQYVHYPGKSYALMTWPCIILTRILWSLTSVSFEIWMLTAPLLSSLHRYFQTLLIFPQVFRSATTCRPFLVSGIIWLIPYHSLKGGGVTYPPAIAAYILYFRPPRLINSFLSFICICINPCTQALVMSQYILPFNLSPSTHNL